MARRSSENGAGTEGSGREIMDRPLKGRKVWIFMREYGYEGERFDSVYESEVDAQAALDTYVGAGWNEGYIEEVEIG